MEHTRNAGSRLPWLVIEPRTQFGYPLGHTGLPTAAVPCPVRRVERHDAER